MHRNSSCFKDILRRRRSASVSTGSVIHSSYVIREVAVSPRPDLDDFRRDGSRGASVGLGTNGCDSAIPADLANGVAVLDVLPNDSAVPASFANLSWRRRFLGPCRCFLGRIVISPLVETADCS